MNTPIEDLKILSFSTSSNEFLILLYLWLKKSDLLQLWSHLWSVVHETDKIHVEVVSTKANLVN